MHITFNFSFCVPFPPAAAVVLFHLTSFVLHVNHVKIIGMLSDKLKIATSQIVPAAVVLSHPTLCIYIL